MTGLTGLIKIEFPSHTVLLSDAGVTSWNGDTYKPVDSLVGRFSDIESMTEGGNDQLPSLGTTFLPQSPVAIGTFTTGAIQKSPMTFSIAEYDTDTGEVIGTPETRFIGFVDQPEVGVAYREYYIRITAVPYFEWLFNRPDGNELSSSFHKSLYPGETGHDNAVNIPIPSAWGAAGPTSSASGATRGATVFGSATNLNAR